MYKRNDFFFYRILGIVKIKIYKLKRSVSTHFLEIRMYICLFLFLLDFRLIILSTLVYVI